MTKGRIAVLHESVRMPYEHSADVLMGPSERQRSGDARQVGPEAIRGTDAASPEIDSLCVAFLAALLVYAGVLMYPQIYRAWYFSSDEYVLVGEVIRFLQLDFRQRFFDMPGTPLISLTAALWTLRYFWDWAWSSPAAGVGIADFTFSRLPELFYLMRSLTVGFYLLSIALIYLVARRITNAAGACVAAMLLALSPIYCSYSSFVRVESIAMCSVLAAILLLLRLLDKSYEPEALSSLRGATARSLAFRLSAVGYLTGLGAGARLHSMTASLPMLALLFWFGTRRPAESRWPGWFRQTLLATSVTASILVLCLVVLPRVVPRAQQAIETLGFAAAYQFFTRGLLAAALVTALLLIARKGRRTGIAATWLVRPEMAFVAAGFAVGFIVAVPTVLWQGLYFLRSLQFYLTSYGDPERAALPLVSNVRTYIGFYAGNIATGWVSGALIVLGAVWAIWAHERRVLAFLIGGGLFFVSKPLDLRMADHHVILWLPFWYVVAGYAPARVWEALAGAGWTAFARQRIALATILLLVALSVKHGPRLALDNMRWTEERTARVGDATEWLKRYASRDATLAFAYFCFNEDVFYEWLHQLAVPMPGWVLGERNVIIWWGHKSTLAGKKGFVCATHSDIVDSKRLEQQTPGEGTDPWSEPQFRHAAQFGAGGSQVDVFEFDLRPAG